MSAANKFTLLICTVGGSPDALVQSLLHWQPARVIFVPSEQTRQLVDTVLRSYAEHAGAPLNPGQYDLHSVPNSEGLGECLKVIRGLDKEVRDWLARGGDYQVVADFTCGTKCMTAALALQARRWPCRYSYVGGAKRSKAGVGIVESGSERIVHCANPWDALGYQAVEDACLLFDRQAFAPAALLLQEARNAADDSVKRTLSTFHQLCEGYALWDRFQHRDALQRLESTLKNNSDLRAMFDSKRAERLIQALQQHGKTLQEIIRQPRSRSTIADLIANADRRGREGRYDDGVARLYRAIEAIAQLALAEGHGITNSSELPLDHVPVSLRKEWEPRAKQRMLLLGLQDDYKLLCALDDRLGKQFNALRLNDPEHSPLSARNQSILAHGYQAITKAVFTDLRGAAMKLGGFQPEELPKFPRLTELGTELPASSS